MLKFLIILNIIVSLKFKKYPKSNSQVIWFHCLNFYGGATRYTMWCKWILKAISAFLSISKNMQEFLLVNWLPNANFGPLATGQSILPDIYLSHAARSFVLKDSCIMWEVENKTMKGDKLFGVNSITCVLTQIPC